MPKNKKHHYVPRFYLKRFSIDGKSINLYNVPSAQLIHRANLKNQCYRNYFYGQEPDVEHILGEEEGNTSLLFKEIDQRRCLPLPLSPGHFLMALHILMQYGRTAYAAETTNEMIDNLMKHLVGPRAEKEGINLNNINIGIKDPGKFNLGIVTSVYPLLLDLKYKLILNSSNEQIIASDNPVVLYNQLLSFRRHGGNTGIACKGLQIFFPLDTEKLLMLYDSEVYGVDSHRSDTVNLTAPQDVYALNTLQMCSALENVYFKSEKINIEALRRKANPFIRKRNQSFNVYPQPSDGDRTSEFIAGYRENIQTNLSLSFVRIKKSAKRWREEFRKKDLQPAVVVRNQRLCDKNDQFGTCQ